MSRDELGALLRLLVDTGKLTAAQAAAIVRKFDAGELDAADLPVPLAETPGGLRHTEQAAAIFAILALLLLLSGKAAVASFLQRLTIPPTGRQAIINLGIRQKLRDRLRADYERRVASITATLVAGGSVAVWQQAMIAEQRAFNAAMMTAGAGRPLTQEEAAVLDQQTVDQQVFLHRFAGEISAKAAIDEPMSAGALASRAALYAGTGWELWHRGNEAAQMGADDTGQVVFWDAVDDRSTCTSCLDAANGSPYLPGQHPWPGADTCEGLGRCRCRLRYVFDMTMWRQLSGVTA